jgi:transitional endoplasmic reticulum ATPase
MPAVAIVDPRPSDYRATDVGTVYLGSVAVSETGAQVGDVVRITTERGRSALGRLAAPTAEGSDAIRFDRFTRQALKAFPHDRVRVERADLAVAPEVVLIPGLDMSTLHFPQLVPHLKELLASRRAPLRSGMLVYARLPNALAGITCEVHYVEGDEGIVADETRIYLEVEGEHDHGPNSSHQHDHHHAAQTVVDTTYEDVGGLTEQIQVVREFVELPLLFPQVYRQLGINPPKGVIFHGAPGTGKTLLARAVANEVNARFFYINGPEIVGTYGGQTEENLRKIFAEATMNPPAVIFVDELDAIAPVRGTTGTLADTRAVTQLLSLMDGLRRAESVIIVGTTNRIDSIDPALRRAGRFDKEVYFPTPSVPGREEILRVQTREMPLSEEALEHLPRIAERAYGFVGADLMELAREAGLNTLRRAAQEFLRSPSPSSYPSSADLVVTRADLDEAVRQVRPASLRESLLSYPSVTFGDVGGLQAVKRRLLDLIDKPLRHPDLFERLGLPTNTGVLLYGPSGTGKTMLAKAIAHESGINFIAIQGPELFSQWLGESESAVRRVFEVAGRAAPCLVFFDQLDAIAPRRSDTDAEGTRAPLRVLNQLLTELDGMEPRSRVMVLGATSEIAAVEPAVLRPGRFGVHLHVGLPDPDERAEILHIHLGGAALGPGVDKEGLVRELVAASDGWSGADLAFLCQAAKLRALEGAGLDGDPALTQEHFLAAIQESAGGLKPGTGTADERR